MNLLLPTLPHHLSFSKSLSTFQPQSRSLLVPTTKPSTTTIRMGGGPRTYPGGVSKWQWKRMQANKSKQLLKARLARERQLFEMRKRAELKAAVSELERPWEVVERAPNLFSVKADEQVKVLADRFQKPGGFDLWSEKDGPQLFESPDELPSARFFPKGVVFSVRPYRKVNLDDGCGGEEGCSDDDSVGNGGGVEFDGGLRRDNGEGNGNGRFLLEGGDEYDEEEGYSDSYVSDGRNGGSVDGGLRRNGNGRRFLLEDDDDDDGEWSSTRLSTRKNGGSVVEFDDRLRRNESENGRRFSLESDEECSSARSGGSSVGGRLRRNVSGRRFRAEGDEEEGSSDSVRSGGSSVGGRLRRNVNGRRFMAEGDEEEGSSDSVRSGGSSVRGRLRKNGNGNGRRFMPKGVDGFDRERSSPLNYGRNGDGRMRTNGNGRRFLSEDVEEERSSASVSDRRHGGSVDGRFRRNENRNGGRVMQKGVYESYREPSNYGRNGGDGRMRRSGNGRRFISEGVDGGRSSAPSSSGRNGGRFDGRLSNKGNGRRFVSNDVGRSNGLSSGRVGSGRQQRRSDSFAGRSGGEYRRGTSRYASRRVRDADSEVYDMDLQQDGSYEFFQKSEQFDSKNW